MMSLRILLAAFTLIALPLPARTRPAPPLDPDYIAALAAANNFLHAWQVHDVESGLLLISDDLRLHTTADAVSLFFAAHPQQTYEITRGRKLAAGRYEFPITLWQLASPTTAPGSTHPKPRATTLYLVRTPRNDWLVDNLP